MFAEEARTNAQYVGYYNYYYNSQQLYPIFIIFSFQMFPLTYRLVHILSFVLSTDANEHKDDTGF